MKRAALVLPGRGSYTERSLGSLPPDHPKVQAAEALRAELGLEPLLALDGAERFEPARHLRPANVAALIYVVAMLDVERAFKERRPVVALGNSMGWYTALAAAGALSFEDGFRLVQEMAQLQEQGEPGGQLIYPLVDETWQRQADRVQMVDQLLAELSGEAFPSIWLGGYCVLAATPKGLSQLTQALPKVTMGKVTYPFRLAQHGPYHTPLLAKVSERAARVLADLDFRSPQIALVDGRGARFGPWTTDVDELRAYTVGHQVTCPYDFTTSVRVALREWAPDELVLPGPGNTLGGVVGQVLVEERWRGIASRADFEAIQGTDQPVIWSMAR